MESYKAIIILRN